MQKSTKDRVKEITDDLEKGIREVFESGRYKQYLKTMSRFHGYSMNNTILIHLQKPDATLIAGFRAWQEKFHRNVMKGEKGIRILAPAPFKKTVTMDVYDAHHNPVMDVNGNQVQKEQEIVIPAFKPVTVFDVSQTDGEPLPALAKTLTGDVDQYGTFLQALERASAAPIAFETLPSNLDGFFSLKDKSITIRSGMSEVQTVCAIIHEVTHSRLHDNKDAPPEERKDSRTMEVEAESVAYAVCAYYGIETGENSFGYIASWSKDKELPELKKSLETISRTASDLITDIDREWDTLQKLQVTALDGASVSDRLEQCLRMTAAQNRAQHGKEACL